MVTKTQEEIRAQFASKTGLAGMVITLTPAVVFLLVYLVLPFPFVIGIVTGLVLFPLWILYLGNLVVELRPFKWRRGHAFFGALTAVIARKPQPAPAPAHASERGVGEIE